MKTLLIIGHNFPEPTTTGAGRRMMQLIVLFLEGDYQITFVSTAKASERSEDLSKLGIATEMIELNSGSFDVFIANLKPSVVVFDRYITEEQFGWRVSEICPDALRILDTEDLHFLRKAREEAVKGNIPVYEANLFTETAKRELASIIRSDLSLIISEFELNLLQETFAISPKILHYLPFLAENALKTPKNSPFFEKRTNFITVGNLHHAPNIDSILYLKKEIWPLIRERLPKAKLYVYGAYAPQQILELHNSKEGFLIKGWTEDVFKAMQEAKVCLAPLRFGAGLKGKLFDAMLSGLPVVTTSIGAEGLQGELDFFGRVADNPDEFSIASVALYTHKTEWLQMQENGFRILEKRFQKKHFSEAFKTRLSFLQKNQKLHRNSNFLGQILQFHTLQSTKYLSKWIEEKKSK